MNRLCLRRNVKDFVNVRGKPLMGKKFSVPSTVHVLAYCNRAT